MKVILNTKKMTVNIEEQKCDKSADMNELLENLSFLLFESIIRIADASFSTLSDKIRYVRFLMNCAIDSLEDLESDDGSNGTSDNITKLTNYIFQDDNKNGKSKN